VTGNVAEEMMMETFINAIFPIIPACACFGPAFLLFGIIFRTPVNGSVRHKSSLAYLMIGTVMITITLYGLLWKVKPFSQ
jgi:hypothetical protein